jgi:hypothetical protein
MGFRKLLGVDDHNKYVTDDGSNQDTDTLDPSKLDGGNDNPVVGDEDFGEGIPDDNVGPVQDDGAAPDTTGEVPDYSGEAGDAQGEVDLDFIVPQAGEVDTPTTSGTADPTQTEWEVTDEMTVQGQMDQLYDRDSPYMERARQKAIRQHLGSGGQNSAMAAGFGELAAMDQAFKVASQDAATYARSGEFNANMANQYSLAEQRFIHNALLSDQAYDQAASLQTQRVAAQLESIVLDYKGRGALMDKELDQFFLKAKQGHAYQLDIIRAQTDGTVRVNALQAISNFTIAGFQSIMEAANDPAFTPEQSQAAMQQGFIWFERQKAAFVDFILGASNAGAGGDNSGADDYDWFTGQSGSGDITQNWANFTGGGVAVNGVNKIYPT